MRQSMLRGLLIAVFGAAVFVSHGVAHGQFGGRETPQLEEDRIPEALKQLIQAIDEETLAKPPERDYKVEKGPVQKAKLFRADPKLLENKFSASLVLLIAADDSGVVVSRASLGRAHNEVRAMHDLPQGVQRLVDGRSQTSIFTGFRPPDLRITEPLRTSNAIPTISGYFNLLSELCPKDHLPLRTAIDFLASPECDREILWNFAGKDGRLAWYVTIYATSEELAEQRARAIVQLFDNGLCRPLQRECLAEAKKSLEAAQKGYGEVAQQTEAIRAKEETLAKPSEITPDILSQLKAQKVMIAIEAAGLDARIKACNAMLKEGPAAPPSTRDSINDMKVRAEVELIGSKEKLDRINTFIVEGNNRESLREQVRQLKSVRSELRRQIDRQYQRRAEAYARLVSLYAPLEIKDNRITISPVEWTN